MGRGTPSYPSSAERIQSRDPAGSITASISSAAAALTAFPRSYNSATRASKTRDRSAGSAIAANSLR